MSTGDPLAVGISDIAVYLPPLQMDINKLVRRRIEEDPSLKRSLMSALEYTCQETIRFPAWWEDCVTMAAQSALNLLKRNVLSLDDLRYLSVGTETTVDLSKPVAAYVEGMLTTAGFPVPEEILTFQVQHACAGGMISLLSVIALLSVNNRPAESGLVICSDVARYEVSSTAEITQGAGSVGMSVCLNPRLLEIDIATAGYSSKDVDDFFRPVGSKTAQVKGSFSLRCYKKAIGQALSDHCMRSGRDPRDALVCADAFAIHSPFKTLPIEAMTELVGQHVGLSAEESRAFLSERDLDASIDPVRQVGNIYSGSMFLGLAVALWKRFQRLGDDIIGREVLLFSYGSGNTAVIVAGKVAVEAPDVIRSWSLDEMLGQAVPATFSQYDQWIERDDGMVTLRDGVIPADRFFLSAIRGDGYRVYDYQRT